MATVAASVPSSRSGTMTAAGRRPPSLHNSTAAAASARSVTTASARISAAPSAGAVGSANMAIRPGHGVAARQGQDVGGVGIDRQAQARQPLAGHRQHAATRQTIGERRVAVGHHRSRPRWRRWSRSRPPAAPIRRSAASGPHAARRGAARSQWARRQCPSRRHPSRLEASRWPVLRAGLRIGSRQPPTQSSDAAACPPVPAPPERHGH